MESLLLFFLVGLFIYLSKHLAKSKHEGIRFLTFFGSGILSGVLVGLVAGPPWPPSVQIPGGGVAVVGGLAGIVLYTADRGKLITRPGIQYFATILLGLVLAGLSYGFVLLYTTLARCEHRKPGEGILIPLVFLLIGFLTVFGYTFPERWFKQRQSRKKMDN